ncbi:MAG: endolytic transglycosylase MltG [bacterium]|nr:endolytic transglycosylase MltG [bacterium]
MPINPNPLTSFLSSFPLRQTRIFLAILFFSLLFYGVFLSAPGQFPANDLVIIPKGAGVMEAGIILSDRHIIHSPALFSVMIKIASQNRVMAGGYLFDKKENLITIARRLAIGDHQLNTVKVTFPEGTTIKEAAEICEKQLPLCSGQEFVTASLGSEGYLFPDTYFFLQSTTATEVVQTMKENFTSRLAPLDKEMRAFGRNLAQVVTMASILEKEAQNFENRRQVASILWKRLNLGMPLQVDATLDYVLDKNTYQLTTKDLATTSPYNTYKHKGLPPTPISNPGIESIKATLSAIPTKNLYYLTDRNGKFYFAQTYDKHLSNKNRYLNQGL